MSMLAAVVHLDGKPADPALIEAMNQRALAVPPVRSTAVVQGSVALGVTHLVRQTCRQPVVNAAGSRWAVVDGVIDNRDALLAELKQEVASDAELLLHCYETWGEQCIARMIGDFAFALWDAPQRRLLCARDALGIRPLYYACHGSTLLVATQIKQLLADAEVDRSLDAEFFADYFAAGLAVRAATPYRGVKRLLPAHYLIAENGNVRIARYWDIHPDQKILYARKDEYVERFADLLRSAVHTYMHGANVVWSDLSGGLDSTSVVCLAQELLRAEGAQGRHFSTVTVVYDEAKRSDERKWARAVVDKYNLDAHFIDGDRHHAFKDFLEGARYWDEPTPQVIFFAVSREYIELLSAAGAETLLTGVAAESVVTDTMAVPQHLADLLRGLQLRRLWRELQVWQPARAVPMSNLILGSCIKPLLMPTRMEFMPPYSYRIPDWVRAEFVKKYDLLQRARYVWMPRRFKSAAEQWQYEKIGRIPSFLVRGCIEQACRVRYPYLYRPLVEFLTSVPLEARLSPKTGKPLLRDAMVGILPESVRTRQTSSSAGHGIYLSFVRSWPQLEEMLRQPILGKLGLVDESRLLEASKQAKYGYSDSLYMLISTLAAEAWLRASGAAA